MHYRDRHRLIAATITATLAWAPFELPAAPPASQNAQPDSALTGPPPQDSNVSVKSQASASADDGAVETRVRSRLAGDAILNNSDITVSSNSAVVTLTGSASGADARAEATGAAGMVEGVKGVVNHLSVSSTAAATGAQIDRVAAQTSTGASDLWLTAKVKSAVLADSPVYSDLTVSVHSGIVALGGTLNDSGHEIPHLKTLIAGIEGVRGVDSSALEGGAK